MSDDKGTPEQISIDMIHPPMMPMGRTERIRPSRKKAFDAIVPIVADRTHFTETKASKILETLELLGWGG